MMGKTKWKLIGEGGFRMITLMLFLLYPMPNMITEGVRGSRNRPKVIM